MTIRNLLSSLSGPVTSAGSWNTVVTTDASTKNNTKNGKHFFRLKVEPSEFFSFLPLQMARASVIGMIARVLVIFTMAAASSVLLPWMPSHAAAAAVTEDVSLMAVPANRPNPSLLRPSTAPRVGKMSAASTLKRKITEMDCATSSSSASITGAVAAMALPPQIEDPTPTRIALFVRSFSALYKINAMIRDVAIVDTMIGRDCFPFARISVRFMPKPKKTTAACRIFFDV